MATIPRFKILGVFRDWNVIEDWTKEDIREFAKELAPKVFTEEQIREAAERIVQLKEYFETEEACEFTVEYDDGSEMVHQVTLVDATTGPYWAVGTEPWEEAETTSIDEIPIDADGQWQADHVIPKLCAWFDLEADELYQ